MNCVNVNGNVTVTFCTGVVCGQLNKGGSKALIGCKRIPQDKCVKVYEEAGEQQIEEKMLKSELLRLWKLISIVTVYLKTGSSQHFLSYI